MNSLAIALKVLMDIEPDIKTALEKEGLTIEDLNGDLESFSKDVLKIKKKDKK